ncbi:minor capsid protein [Escherichia coli]|nr:phage minor head protein [Escherichia coli]EFO2070598.1 phage head morphogenesis protein [Escherichia coli O8]EKK2473695.1 minor capsid protein [Escherichia coli O91]EED0799472.1 phage head morphogenesis protein [Escherichia coli]EEQ9035268.1 phage head morphogenesis protein [Escherichia coli]EES5530472.1 phage head morphogenesis protein [Escherichia coli]
MSVTSSELAYSLTLPPERAIGYLESKGYVLSHDWRDVWEEEHARAFTVAKVTRLDILEDIRRKLQQALDEGRTAAWFRKELEPVLKEKGWWGEKEITDPDTGEVTIIQQGSTWRLDTIYRTNMTVVYSAGRWAEQMENVDDRPYWKYTAIQDNRTRKTHEALHGTVMRYDDPFWEAFYPPNGWGCRCSVVAMSERDITRRKVTVTSSGDSLGYIAKRVSDMAIDSVAAFVTPTGIVVSPDIGWSYSPGAAYRPDLAKYGGDLAALAQQELVP